MTTINVNEVYAAHQGEGPSLGKPSVFLRLHGCPVACAWCDTAFTWDGSEKGRRLTIEEAYGEVVAIGHQHVVVTGGEPLIQREALTDLARRLLQAGHTVEVETSGTQEPLDVALVRYVVSPKMPSANARIQPDVALLRRFATRGAYLKPVIQDDDDLEAALALIGATAWPHHRLGLMPEGQTRQEQLERLGWLLGRALALGLPVTPRMHIHAHDKERRT